MVVRCRIGNIAEAKPEALQLMWMPDKQGKYELEVRRQIRHPCARASGGPSVSAHLLQLIFLGGPHVDVGVYQDRFVRWA